jgi:hypothetical protein
MRCEMSVSFRYSYTQIDKNALETLNESVGKALLAGEDKIFGGYLTLPKHEIVDCGAFCEVFFFHISPKNLLGDFFYRLNACHHWFVWGAVEHKSSAWHCSMFMGSMAHRGTACSLCISQILNHCEAKSLSYPAPDRQGRKGILCSEPESDRKPLHPTLRKTAWH